MRKTGESYTTARLHVLGKRDAAATKSPAKTPAATKSAAKKAAAPKPAAKTKTSSAKKSPAPAKQPTIDYAALAGLSDETIAAKTGCTWERWVGHLDYWGAADKPHREIADHVHEKFSVPGWWAQTVTVGYERIKGLRAIGQRRDGGFEANKSKTLNASAAAVFKAFAHARVRKHWLPVSVTVKKATPNRSVRMLWHDGTPVEVWIVPKGAKKTAAQVQHRKLASREDADSRKKYWDERLSALAEVLG